EDDVGSVLAGGGHGFLAVPDGGHDVDPGVEVEHDRERLAHRRLVVGDQEPDGGHRGSSSRTTQPCAPSGPAYSVPPASPARSRMPTSPIPLPTSAAGAASSAGPLSLTTSRTVSSWNSSTSRTSP